MLQAGKWNTDNFILILYYLLIIIYHNAILAIVFFNKVPQCSQVTQQEALPRKLSSGDFINFLPNVLCVIPCNLKGCI